jgi:hypothetical protein
MSKMVTYKVLRSHEGDRFYKDGETRELSTADAKHLVDLGVLEEAVSGSEKAEMPPENKQEASPLNKAELAATSKRAQDRKD